MRKKKIEISVSNLMKNFSLLIKDLLLSNYMLIPAHAIGTVKSIKISSNIGYLSLELFFKSLVTAFNQLLEEINKENILLEVSNKEFDRIIKSIQIEKDSYFDHSLLTNPSKLLLFDQIDKIIDNFLDKMLVSTRDKKYIKSWLPETLTLSLKKNWNKEPLKYDCIQKELKTPFDNYSLVSNSWLKYRNILIDILKEKYIGENFTLDELYLDLRAYYTQTKISLDGKKDNENIVVDLCEELLDWIKAKSNNDDFRFIKGCPGSGKSLFMKKLANKLTLTGYKVIYISLKRINISKYAEESILDYLNQYYDIDDNPFNNNNELIILLDGLDEVVKLDESLQDSTNRFLSSLYHMIEIYNSKSKKIKTIISGRDIVVQNNIYIFKDKSNNSQKLVYTLIPFYLADSDNNEYIDNNNFLEIDQRDIWWKKFGKLTNRDIEKCPEILKKGYFHDISIQPLLNYLLSFIYKLDSNIDLIKPDKLYPTLFERIINKAHDGNIKNIRFNRLDNSHLLEVFKEIAYICWAKKDNCINISNIKNHFDNDEKFLAYKNLLNEISKNDYSSLLALFYFKKSEKDILVDTFEFSHKSFMEYFIALKLKNEIYKILASNIDKTIKTQLLDWIKLFGDKDFNESIIRFFKYELDNFDSFTLEKFQNKIVEYINYYLEHDLPLEDFKYSNKTFKKDLIISKNSILSLFTIHSLIAQKTNIISNIKWPDKKSFSNILIFISEQLLLNRNKISNYLNHLNINNCMLDHSYLNAFNMTSSKICDASLSGTNLDIVNFSNSDSVNVNKVVA